MRTPLGNVVILVLDGRTKSGRGVELIIPGKGILRGGRVLEFSPARQLNKVPEEYAANLLRS